MKQIQKHVTIAPELWAKAEPLLDLHGHTLTALVNTWLRRFVNSKENPTHGPDKRD